MIEYRMGFSMIINVYWWVVRQNMITIDPIKKNASIYSKNSFFIKASYEPNFI